MVERVLSRAVSSPEPKAKTSDSPVMSAAHKRASPRASGEDVQGGCCGQVLHGSQVCATAFPCDAEISISGCKRLLQSVALVSVSNFS